MLTINEAAKGSPHAHLKNAINYICKKEKTEGGNNIFGINISKENALDEMLNIKQLYNKTDKRQGYHFILSFSPDDNVDTELCNEITKEFCDRFFQNRFQIIAATHNDQAHMHSHIIFNSVAMDNGLKWHYKKGDWQKFILPIINELCKKHNLSTIELGGMFEKDMSVFGNKHDKTQVFTKIQIKKDIESAIRSAYSLKNFISILRGFGYKVDDSRSKTNISILPPGRERRIRLTSLDSSFTKSGIEKMISDNSYGQNEKKRFQKSKKVFSYNEKKIVGITAVWCKKNIRMIRIGNSSYRVNVKYYNQMKNFYKRMEEFWFLHDHEIKTKNALESFIKRQDELTKINNEKKKEVYKEKADIEEKNKIRNKKNLLRSAYETFLNGNLFFEDEYKEYTELEEEQKKRNTSDGKTEKENISLNKKLSLIFKTAGTLSKNKRLAKACLKEINTQISPAADDGMTKNLNHDENDLQL